MIRPISLIHNPQAKRGLTTQQMTDLLKEHEIGIDEVFEMTDEASLRASLTALQSHSKGTVIVAGGDGTLSAVLGGLAGASLDIGIIPLGTTNNYARSLEIPLGDPAAAIKHMKQRSARPVDLGRINDTYFINVAGIGLSAMIASGVSHELKRYVGRLAYAIAGVRQLIRQRPFWVELRDPDHDVSLTVRTRQLIVANGKYHAGKEIAMDAHPDNGKLVVFALGRGSIVSLLFGLIKFYVGRREKVSTSTYLKAQRIEIIAEPGQAIEIDGETGIGTPVLASVEKAAIKVRF